MRLLLVAIAALSTGCFAAFGGSVLPEVPPTHGLPGGAYASGIDQAIGNLASPPSAAIAYIQYGTAGHLKAANVAVSNPPATVGLNFNTGPIAYQTYTGRDVQGLVPIPVDVRAEACATGIFIPIGVISRLVGVQIPDLDISWGSGGYAAAVAKAFGPGVTALADVRADTHILSVLGIVGQRCTVVHARAYH